MFLLNWIKMSYDKASRHPGAVITLVPALFVGLGLVYQSCFFGPLSVPVFQLSSPSDFLLPGLRHSLYFSLTVVVAVALTMLAFLLLVCVAVFVLNLPGLIWKWLLWRLLNLCKVASPLLYWFSLPLCLLYMPFFCLYWSAMKFRASSPENCISLNDGYTSARDMLRQFRTSMDSRLDRRTDSVKNDISRLKSEPGNHWRCMNRILSGSCMFNGFILLSVLIIALLTGAKASQDRDFITGYDKETPNFHGRLLAALTGGFGFYNHLSEALAVQVRFRSGRHGPQNLLQVGGTSDFLLFWDDKQSTQVCSQFSTDENADTPNEKPEGEILIASKTNILFIRPTDANNMPADEDSCKQESKDIVEAIDKLNDSLAQKLTNLAAVCSKCPDIDYSGIASQLQEINSTFNDVKTVFESRLQDDQ